MTGHSLRVVLDRDTVCLSVVCNEADGTNCRSSCVVGCEGVCTDPDEHIRPIDHCLAAEWVTLEGCASQNYAGGDGLALHDGMPINLTWNGDTYEWTAVKVEDAEVSVSCHHVKKMILQTR
jgi:hypothetical protein